MCVCIYMFRSWAQALVCGWCGLLGVCGAGSRACAAGSCVHAVRGLGCVPVCGLYHRLSTPCTYIYILVLTGVHAVRALYTAVRAPRCMRDGLYIQRCGHSGTCRAGLIYNGVGLIYSTDYAYSIRTCASPHAYREQTHSLHSFTLIQCFC